MNTIKFLNPENASTEEVATWPVREAARGVVVDNNGMIALLHVSKKDYYKLPGGGIDPGETREVAFKRECLEEIGCKVEIEKDLGIVEEWRKVFNLKQISYCYVGKVIGEKTKPSFTESELSNGFEIVWLEKSEALDKLTSAKTDSVEGFNYIQPRDVAIMEAFLNR